MRHLSCLAIVTTASMSLACGGLWGEALAKSFSEMTAQLSSVPPGPQVDRTRKVLDEGFISARQGDLGVWDLAIFESSFDDAMADGQLSQVEVAGLEAQAAGFGFAPIDTRSLTDVEVAERTRLLAIKRAADEQAVATVGLFDTGTPTDLAMAPTAEFAGMTLPQLQERLLHLGWTIDDCNAYTEASGRWTSCDARHGPLHAMVSLTRHATPDDAMASSWTGGDETGAIRRDGLETLAVWVTDGGRASAVRDACSRCARPWLH